jgi:hypothetical protein
MTQTKTQAYFDLIERHVLAPIKNTEVRNSCVASLLLLFAAIDGLGRLLHSDPNAGVADRFKFFLKEYMGGKYKTHCDRIYQLRCSLAHNALSLSAFMSRTMMGESHHLRHDTALGVIFVSTPVFLKDFWHVFDELKALLATQEGLRKQAEDRLDWISDEQRALWMPFSTPPGPITFISEKLRVQNQPSDASSEPASGADSSAPQG